VLKAGTHADNGVYVECSDVDNELTDIKEEVDPLLTLPAVKTESQVSCVFLVGNI
jgi:hypothetical protein